MTYLKINNKEFKISFDKKVIEDTNGGIYEVTINPLPDGLFSDYKNGIVSICGEELFNCVEILNEEFTRVKFLNSEGLKTVRKNNQKYKRRESLEDLKKWNNEVENDFKNKYNFIINDKDKINKVINLMKEIEKLEEEINNMSIDNDDISCMYEINSRKLYCCITEKSKLNMELFGLESNSKKRELYKLLSDALDIEDYERAVELKMEINK